MIYDQEGFGDYIFYVDTFYSDSEGVSVQAGFIIEGIGEVLQAYSPITSEINIQSQLEK